MIQKERIQKLNNLELNKKGDYLIYWMQSSQRTSYNHALEYAIKRANELGKPLVVYFNLISDFPEANERHYYFMLQGLIAVKKELQEKNINFVIRNITPEKGLLKLADEAQLVVVDRGYLNLERKWRRAIAGKLNCSFIQVESNVVVPIEVASDKEEYAAYTIRPKINRKLKDYLVPLREREINHSSLDLQFESLKLNDISSVIRKLGIKQEVKKIDAFTGGLKPAISRLKDFIKNKLAKYETMRNNPVYDYQSNLSPYLHFGQISPVQIALEVSKSKNKEAIDDFLEQLIVRRELSINFIFYNIGYSAYETLNLPNWAYETLEEHSNDTREYIYSLEEFEKAKTHDSYWNAAQTEMVVTGKMHNYMRMYWVKKILEWTESPQEAYKIAIHLNNKYELDGRDPNGFTGVAWCFGKHDRPWKERPIFGKVRYMNARGLERKFDITKYVEKIEEISLKQVE